MQSLAEAANRIPISSRHAIRQTIAAEAAARIDYVEIVDPDTLDPVSDLKSGALVAMACTFGKTRLIDNILLPPMQARFTPAEEQDDE